MGEDMFSPIPFGDADIDPNEIIERLDKAANTSDDLTGRILDSVGDSLTNLGQVEADLTGRILSPAADQLTRANDTQNALFNQLGAAITGRLSSASELERVLSSQLREGGIDPGAEDVAGVSFASGRPGDEIAVGGIEPETEPGGIAVGGIEPEPPGTPPEVAGAPDEPRDGPQPPRPETIQLPPPPIGPFPGEQEDIPQTPPQPQPQPRPQPQVVVGGGPQIVDVDVAPGQPCPAPVVNITCPTPEAPPDAPGVTPERPDQVSEPRDPPAPRFGDEDLRCGIDAYSIENLSGAEFGSITGDTGPIALFLYGGESHEQAINRLENNVAGTFNPFMKVWWRFQLWGARLNQRIDQWLVEIGKTQCIANPVFAIYSVMSILFGFLNMVFGGALAKSLQVLTYKKDRLCPVTFPDHNEATEAFVRGTISKEVFENWVQQNDRCLEPWQRMLEGRMNRVEPLMALQMFMRGFIDDQEFEKQVRKNGFDAENLAKAFRDLGFFIPPITDLVRFMVRDVEDKEIVDQFGLDANFEKKWDGEAKRWGEQQGIRPEVARRYWRAHWRIPSPTQLFEMFHRSRGKRDDDPTKITLDMVRTALEQDDLLPFWVDPLIETTFARMTRREARSAFETGAIDRDRLRQNFIVLGLKDEDADDLVRWAEIQRIKTLTNTPEARLFRDGIISEAQYLEQIKDIKLSEDDRTKLIFILSNLGKRRFQTRCISAIRKRFLTGELDRTEAETALREAGLAPIAAEDAVESFACEARARGRTASTTQLCTWLEQGSIDSEEFVERLERIGWTREDALKILVTCQRKINERQARNAERLARQERAALEKQQREVQAEQRRLERQRQTLARNREKAERAKSNREKILQRTIAKFAAESGLDVATAGSCVRGIERELAAESLLTVDERIQTVTVAVERLKPVTCEQLRTLSAQLADQLLQFGFLDDAFVLSLRNVPN